MLYTWIWFSNNIIHNSFLAIIADGYIEQTKVGMFDWLETDVTDPEAASIIHGESDEEESFFS
jgi:hypothetical protein